MVVGQNPNQTEYSVVGVDRLTVKTKGTGIARFHGHKKEHQYKYQFIMSTSYMVCSGAPSALKLFFEFRLSAACTSCG